MPTTPDDMVYRLGIPPEEGRHPGLRPSCRRENGMLVERDVAVPMRDGVRLYVDVFRPTDAVDVPTILTYAPYGKHAYKSLDMFRRPDGQPDGAGDLGLGDITLSPYTVWEGPDPLHWCRQGYAVVNADARGSWESQGTLTFFSAAEARDGYDLVEWAAAQPWSNGRVGMSGVSYLAWTQWNVAATCPPHLRAINPWEGFTDVYRDMAMHGGIPETTFRSWWIESTAFSRNRVEDITAMARRHPYVDDYWAQRAPDLRRIEIPVYAVVDWGDHGLHTRGTIEGFKNVSSQHKWLEVHGRLKWAYFYRAESLRRQRAFFDAFLRPSPSTVFDRPRVEIEVRESYLRGTVRPETTWPPDNTAYTVLSLEAATRALLTSPPAREEALAYDSDTGHAEFTHTFDEDTELTGNMALRLWVQAPDADDLDLFVGIDKLDVRGNRVGFAYHSRFPDGPVALGWLRASHRELDPRRSTPQQPWHTHQRPLPLPPGEPVAVDVEILPSSTLFRRGESVRLVVQGTEIMVHPDAPVAMGHPDTHNTGRHVIHTGGRFDSHLLVPIIRRGRAEEENP